MNRPIIEQRTVRRFHDQATWYEVVVWDNYTKGTAVITSLFKGDFQLLQYCKDIASDEDKSICSFIEGINMSSHSVTINGTLYEWEQIRHIFPDK